MTDMRRYWWSVLVALLTLAPVLAHAQAVARSFEELQPMLHTGQTVIVTDAAGQRTKGKVTLVSPSSFAMSAGDKSQTFGNEALSAHFGRDGLKNGIQIGGGVGVLAAVLAAEGYTGGDDLVDLAVYSVLCVPAGIGIGALVDWAFRHDELHVDYQRIGSSSRSVKVSPWLGRQTGGVALSIGF